MRFFLSFLSSIYKMLMCLRENLFKWHFIKVYQPNVPVLSIGNLTMGGTGKTPITDYCLKYLVEAKKNVAVVSRSYRAQASKPCQVDLSHPLVAQFFGDEPALLAQKNPDVAVFVGRKKWQTARYAERQKSFDLLIVDDGFQHRKLHRDLDFVILDATESLENYDLLPKGRGRETWQSLSRASVVLVNKCNLVDEEQMAALRERLPVGKEVIYFRYDIDGFKNGEGPRVLSREAAAGKTFFLVSAIARPDLFRKMVSEIGEVSVASLEYRDHHQYTKADASFIEGEFRKSKADFLVTTEKDFVKLQAVFSDPNLLWRASLTVAEQGVKGRLYEIIGQVLR